MKALSILWFAFSILIAVAWIACMILWLRKGARFPRYIHVLAIVLTICGIISCALLDWIGSLTIYFALLCLFVPPLATYGFWLWCFGPWLKKD